MLSVSAPDPLLPPETRPSQSLGFVKSLLAVGCMVGVLALMAGKRIEPRDPKATQLAPPILPQGAVLIGAVGAGPKPTLLGHAVAIQAGERSLVLTARTLLGPPTHEGPPTPALRLVDPDQRLAVEVGDLLALGVCRPDGTPHVPQDYALFALPPQDATSPLPVQVEPPAIGQPLWVAAHSERGLALTLVEVAALGPQELTLFMSRCSVEAWAGAPLLNAEGQVVGTVSEVLQGQDALLVQATPIKEALAALEAQ